MQLHHIWSTTRRFRIPSTGRALHLQTIQTLFKGRLPSVTVAEITLRHSKERHLRISAEGPTLSSCHRSYCFGHISLQYTEASDMFKMWRRYTFCTKPLPWRTSAVFLLTAWPVPRQMTVWVPGAVVGCRRQDRGTSSSGTGTWNLCGGGGGCISRG